jgi:hypothetical protein
VDSGLYRLLREPQGDAYRTLLAYSLGRCDLLQLVVRPTIDLDGRAQDVLSRLSPFSISSTEQSEWPGTQLWKATATVHRFRWCSDAMDILIDAEDGLFSWVQPGLPEDLCLLRPDGSIWLATTAHEHDGWFCMSSSEMMDMKEAIPSLSLATPMAGHS